MRMDDKSHPQETTDQGRQVIEGQVRKRKTLYADALIKRDLREICKREISKIDHVLQQNRSHQQIDLGRLAHDRKRYTSLKCLFRFNVSFLPTLGPINR